MLAPLKSVPIQLTTIQMEPRVQFQSTARNELMALRLLLLLPNGPIQCEIATEGGAL